MSNLLQLFIQSYGNTPFRRDISSISFDTSPIVILKFSGLPKHLSLSMRQRCFGLMQSLALHDTAPRFSASLSRDAFINCKLSTNRKFPILNAIYFSILYGIGLY